MKRFSFFEKHNLHTMTVFTVFVLLLMLIGSPLKAQDLLKKQNYNKFQPFKMIFLPDTHISFKYETEMPQSSIYNNNLKKAAAESCSAPMGQKDEKIIYNESFVIFQDAIKNIKTAPDLKFVVFGGDLIDNADKELGDLPLFIDSIEDTRLKYYTILGDREADLKEEYTKQDFCAEFRSNGFENPNLTYWVQEPVSNILLIGLDTSVVNTDEGELPPEELLWLDNILKSNPDKFIIISMHHPAFISTDLDNNVWKKYILKNNSEFLNVINKYPQVKLVLSGHHHNYAVKNSNGKLFMALPSLVTYPDNYKILTVYPDRVEVENKDISFKQITKKAKTTLAKTSYAKEFNPKNPDKILKFQEGGKISRTKVFYFEEKQ